MINMKLGYVYKLCINDDTVDDCYIGSTFDIDSRKSQHKYACNNINNKDYNLKLYKFIRNNGGYDKWSFKILEEKQYNNKFELYDRERYYNIINKPTLNSYRVTKTVTICEHNIRGRICVICNGSCICMHKKRYARCNICCGVYCNTCNKNIPKEYYINHLKTNKHNI
jgi:hypothetical protein